VDESCLPAKIYLGHVKSLMGRCDCIFVPRFERFGKNDLMCDRFMGLPDIVRNAYPDARLIGFNLAAATKGSQRRGYLSLGKSLGSGRIKTLLAWRRARLAQAAADQAKREAQKRLFQARGVKVLLAAQPYLIHDPYVGRPLTALLREQGVIPLYSDHCCRRECRQRSPELCDHLYWMINKETVGAIVRHRRQVDGVILLAAYPCGADALVNELVLRKVRDLPVIQIILDEQQSEGGLATRLESFVDILKARKQEAAHG
jgi:predicted nucleotide-binding protein (sugar kinase/HSP70/actin superfamily)